MNSDNSHCGIISIFIFIFLLGCEQTPYPNKNKEDDLPETEVNTDDSADLSVCTTEGESCELLFGQLDDSEEYDTGERIIIFTEEGWGDTDILNDSESSDTQRHTASDTDDEVATDTQNSVVVEGKGTFFTSTVAGDLIPEDRVQFENEFAVLGFQNLGTDTDISTETLQSLLQRVDIDVLYHSGHGIEGIICTADGELSADAVPKINVGVFISATCSTMSPTLWKNQMGERNTHLLGYTDESWDGPDVEVVHFFAEDIAEGASYTYAWYDANQFYSQLADRWIVYVRENSEIVEYSARQRALPSKKNFFSQITEINETVAAVPTVAGSDETFYETFSRIISEYVVDEQHRQRNRFRRNDKIFLPDIESEAAEVITLVNGIFGDTLPSDAVLSFIRPIHATRQNEPHDVGHNIRYERRIGGLTLKSNGIAQFISVLENNSEIVSISSNWNTLSPTGNAFISDSKQLMSVDKALIRASVDISSYSKQLVTITAVMPCLSIEKGKLVPAYAFETETGAEFVVSAFSGELCN